MALGLALMTVLSFEGCSSESSRVTYDLVRLFPLAEPRQDILDFDIGTPSARPFLRQGWSWNEESADFDFVWSQGSRSELEFRLLTPRPLQLEARAFGLPGLATAQSVTVLLQDRTVGEIEVGPRPETYRLELPTDRVQHGRNLLAFVYDSTREVGRGRNRRSLAVAWDWIRLSGSGAESDSRLEDPITPPRLPQAELAFDRLLLPAATGLAYPLDLEPGDELFIRQLKVSNARLEVALETGDETKELAFVDRPSQRYRLPLKAQRPGAAKLVLLSLGDGEVLLDNPQIRSVAREVSPTPEAR